MYSIYNLITWLAFIVFFPPFFLFSRITGKHHRGLGQRLGHYSVPLRNCRRGSTTGRPRIWLHAASVGETGVALNMIGAFQQLMPECALVLSTVTEQGHEFARAKVPPEIVCIYAPIDVAWPVGRALAAVAPDVLVCLETEIWPHLFREARKRGIVTVIANGRISPRSYGRYRFIKPLLASVLKGIDGFSMISPADAERIILLGAPPERVKVNGNAKYDHLRHRSRQGVRERMRAVLNISREEAVLVAGSTRRNEEKILLDSYRRVLEHFPRTVLIVAPRHTRRAQEILNLFEKSGLAARLKSDLDKSAVGRNCPVVVVDTMGELEDIYSLASVAFCGGSLVPLGGQNVLEAAAWGVPVLFGPSLDDFADAGQLLLQSGGGLQVKDGRELSEQILELLSHPQKADAMGRAAREAVLAGEPAALKHVRLVHSLLENRPVN